MNSKDIVNSALTHSKRIILIVTGFTILFIGVIMVFLPGPAVVVIPLGLTLLAGEFIWARKLLNKVKSGVQNVRDSINKK